MKTLLLACLPFALAGIANAVPIAANSELSINGADSFTDSSITFTGLANVGGTTGDFTKLADCDDCVTMIGTLTASSSGLLYNVGDAGQNSTLVLHPPQQFVPGSQQGIPSLTVSGTGTLTLSGFDATEGRWELTTQGPQGGAQVTFSATAIPVGQAVPEPGSMILLASALSGLGLLWPRR